MSKASLRQSYKALRRQLPQSRRVEAQEAVLDELYPELASFNCILSFASFNDEINLWPLNALLAKENRLCLPKMENVCFAPYRVKDIQSDLIHTTAHLLEPDPEKCSKIDKQALDCILVPGLCFDQFNYRLGYGFGHFDRFLKDIISIPTFGLGFKEQLIPELPLEAHDISLTKIYLF